MKIETNSIILKRQKELQDSIQIQQKELNDIETAFKKATDFLLNNDFSEIKETDDILIEVMKCLKRINEQMHINDEDIRKINDSIISLKSLTNSVNKEITSQLKDKINSITEDTANFSKKIDESMDFLNVLMPLQTNCPSCLGNSKGNCIFCNGVGVTNVSMILKSENDISEGIVVDYPIYNNNYEYQAYDGNINHVYEENNNQGSKFVINKKK